MSDPNYKAISQSKWTLTLEAFNESPQVDGRFAGTPKHQQRLSQMIRELFDGVAGDDPLYIKFDDALGLAQNLELSGPNWSIGQYTASLASLLK